MFTFKSFAFIIFAISSSTSVLGQMDSGVFQCGPQKPPPSAILSPERGQEFAYGGIVPFVYNYTYDATLPSAPMVDLLLGRMIGDSSGVFEVALGLNCRDDHCTNGTLTYDIDMSKWGYLLGIGSVQIYTIERVSTVLNGDPMTMRRTSARSEFKVSLEPMTGRVDRPGMFFQQW